MMITKKSSTQFVCQHEGPADHAEPRVEMDELQCHAFAGFDMVGNHLAEQLVEQAEKKIADEGEKPLERREAGRAGQ
jgi:hypothetical protein